MQLLWLQARSKSVAEALIHGYLESTRKKNTVQEIENIREITMLNRDSTENEAHRIDSSWPRQRALVVDGKTLTVILDPRSGLTGLFLELTKTCSSVLACRATPLQKVMNLDLFCLCFYNSLYREFLSYDTGIYSTYSKGTIGNEDFSDW